MGLNTARHILFSLSVLSLAAAQILNFVAHQDDDLLFLSPNVITNVWSGATVRTIFLTAGDAGQGSDYWASRQAGSLAAYAKMAGVTNSWDQISSGIDGYEITFYSLTDSPQVTLGFMHLPDGGLDGSGYQATGYTSLQKLWQGAISSIGTVDNSGTKYTKDQLLNVITKLIDNFRPGQINTMDYVGNFGDGDHPDHYATAYFVQSASQASSCESSLVGYLGYSINNLPVNLDSSDIADKTTIFYAYAAYDSGTCASADACASRAESGWLQRQYTVS